MAYELTGLTEDEIKLIAIALNGLQIGGDGASVDKIIHTAQTVKALREKVADALEKTTDEA